MHAGRPSPPRTGAIMNNIIYIVGLIVVVLAILSFLGLR
ncbi:LPXTG cell wall anchor domain-containing protein [Bosea sp. LjRoot9]